MNLIQVAGPSRPIKVIVNVFFVSSEINGMTICYKMGNVQDTANSGPNPLNQPEFGKPVSPNQPSYPKIPDADDHDYEIIMPPNPVTPTRPAPMRPAPTPPGPPLPVSTNTANSCNTLGHYAALEGVPFILNPRLSGSGSNNLTSLPTIRARTLAQLDQDYNYDFRAERHS